MVLQNMFSALSFLHYRKDDDFVDRLSYFYTTSFLTMMAILVSFKQVKFWVVLEHLILRFSLVEGRWNAGYPRSSLRVGRHILKCCAGKYSCFGGKMLVLAFWLLYKWPFKKFCRFFVALFDMLSVYHF